jgi:hypothetical protein
LSSASEPKESPRGASLRLLAVLLVWVAAACAPVGPSQQPREDAVSEKIRLDLSGLNADGLYGPPNGLRALSYEFCIPARQDLADEVRAIDPTVQISASSRGRIGCSTGQYLGVGSTHQPGFRMVLDRLARLAYVTHIDQSYAE